MHLSLINEIVTFSPVTIEEIHTKTCEFHRETAKFRTGDNLITNYISATPESEQETVKTQIETYARGARPVFPQELIPFIIEFLELEKEYGTDEVRAHYNSEKMSVEEFIRHLYADRPLALYDTSDTYLLAGGHEGCRNPGKPSQFATIGTSAQQAPFTIDQLVSLRERLVATLAMGVSSQTKFINNAALNNNGVRSTENNYTKDGVLLSFAGVRNEREDEDSHKFVMITPTQNTKEKGYGRDADPQLQETRILRLFAKLYAQLGADLPHDETGNPYFPTYEEAKLNLVQQLSNTGKFEESIISDLRSPNPVDKEVILPIANFYEEGTATYRTDSTYSFILYVGVNPIEVLLDLKQIHNNQVFLAHQKLLYKTSIAEAQARGIEARKDKQTALEAQGMSAEEAKREAENYSVTCMIAAMGLRTWAKDKKLQTKIALEAIDWVIKNSDLSHINKIILNGFLEEKPNFSPADDAHPNFTDRCGHQLLVKIVKTQNPCDLVPDNELLVVWQPADHISAYGNEYWVDHLSASGDPALACASLIELFLWQVNPNLHVQRAMLHSMGNGPSLRFTQYAKKFTLSHDSPFNYIKITVDLAIAKLNGKIKETNSQQSAFRSLFTTVGTQFGVTNNPDKKALWLLQEFKTELAKNEKELIKKDYKDLIDFLNNFLNEKKVQPGENDIAIGVFRNIRKLAAIHFLSINEGYRPQLGATFMGFLPREGGPTEQAILEDAAKPWNERQILPVISITDEGMTLKFSPSYSEFVKKVWNAICGVYTQLESLNVEDIDQGGTQLTIPHNLTADFIIDVCKYDLPFVGGLYSACEKIYEVTDKKDYQRRNASKTVSYSSTSNTENSSSSSYSSGSSLR